MKKEETGPGGTSKPSGQGDAECYLISEFLVFV